MGGAGALHFVIPHAYARIVPDFLGKPEPWVYGSGIAEIACAGLIAVPRTRRLGALATAAVLVGVFPANIYHALSPDLPYSGLLAWLRLPLQVPLVLWAVAVARRAPALAVARRAR